MSYFLLCSMGQEALQSSEEPDSCDDGDDDDRIANDVVKIDPGLLLG